MKHNRGYFSTSLYALIVISLSVIAVIVYFSVQQYRVYQEEKITLQENLDEIEIIRQELSSLKNQKPQVITKIINPDPSPSAAAIVKQWAPRIAYIECQYNALSSMIPTLKSYGIDTRDQFGSGSGFLMELFDSRLQETNIVVITNMHVLTGHNGFSPAKNCTVKIGNYTYAVNGINEFAQPVNKERTQIYVVNDKNTQDNENEIKLVDGVSYTFWNPDVGYLIIENPATEIKRLAQEPFRCAQKPDIGENILMLGFPSIGASESITATEGIVAGTDSKYFVTSAKIEQGNSGGGAFWIKENCYIGIPSFALTGLIESLGRIFDITNVFSN